MRHLSAQEILTQPVGRPAPLSEEAVRAALEWYDLGTLRKVVPEPGGTANANVRVETSQGPFYVRRRARHYAAPHLAAHDQAYRAHLAAHGLPVAPPLWALDGQPAVRVDGDVYEVTAGRPGGPPDLSTGNGTASVGNGTASVPYSLLTAAGELLGRLHVAAADFQPPTDKGWGRYDPPAAALALTEHLLALDPTLEQAAVLDTLRGCSAALCASFPDSLYEALPHLTIHGDYHPANLKCEGAVVTGLFDFDVACWQPRMLDVADGLLYFGLVREGTFDGRSMAALTRGGTLDPARMRSLASGYRQHVTLTPEEVAAVPQAMLARWIYSRLAGLRKVPREEWLTYATADVTGPAEWLREQAAVVEEILHPHA